MAPRSPFLPPAAFPDAEAHSRGFRQSRAARRNALLEDYVELIDDLIADGGEARRDIAARPASRADRRRVAPPDRRGIVRSRIAASSDRAASRSQAEPARHAPSRLPCCRLAWRRTADRRRGIEHHVSDETLAAFRHAMAGNKGRKLA